MSRRRLVFASLVLVLCSVAATLTATAGPERGGVSRHLTVTATWSSPLPAPVLGLELLHQEQAAEAAAFTGWVDSVGASIVAYIASSQAEDERIRREYGGRYGVPTTPDSTSSGPHSDLWWQGVAQCEQGGRNDAYFGYFSFMDGSAGGKSWAEQVAMGNALLSRPGVHEVGAWAALCVARGYEFSPGG